MIKANDKLNRFGRFEVRPTVLTFCVIALTLAVMASLWFYTKRTPEVRLIIRFLSLVIIVSMVVFIDQLHKKHQLKLEQLVSKRTIELEAAKAASEAARVQAEQLNRQLQASVGRTNLVVQQAMETGQARNRFLAEISHEIRIPMNAIMGFSEMLSEENLTEQQKKQVRMIRDSSRGLLQLVNDILDFSKIQAGKLEIEMGNCSIESILMTIESLMRHAATEKNIEFEIVRCQPLPEFIRTDSARLKQCLLNLISSAVRSADKGHIYVRVFWDNSSDKPFIRFDIENTEAGVFIAAPKFWPGQTQTGVNLEMTITRHLAELLGGGITISKEPNKGSVFTLIIPTGTGQIEPVERSSEVIVPGRKAPVETDILQLAGKVLVAEDSPTNQALVELLLKKLGVETVIVADGRQVVEKAMAENFDAILIDIQMPVMNGYEAVKLLRENGIKIPIIALTACAMKGDDKKCFAAGCDDYLSKPIDRKELIKILSKYLSCRSIKQAALPGPSKSEVPPKADKAEIEIDWRQLSERIGSEELIDEIVPIFIKDNTERIKMLSAAVKKGQEQEIKFYAHSVKGATATIGATKISELAKELEAAVRNGDSSRYKPVFEELNSRFAGLVVFLSKSNWKQIAQQA